MDLADHLLALVAPLRVGDAVTGDARLEGASTELGLRLTCSIGTMRVHVELTPLETARRFATATERFALGYRADGALAPATGKALCEAVAERIRTNEVAVLDAIAEDAARATQQDSPQARIREVRVRRILERAGPRHYTLTPYVGCLIGCRFCYAQSRVATVRRLERLPLVPWGSFVDVRVNAAEALESDLADNPPGAIKFCPIVSDPYQAIERKAEITRACLEVLARAGPRWPTLVLTRSALIERDAALLGSFPHAWAGMSIPTIDEEAAQHFEPRAATIAERLHALDRLRTEGVRTFAIVQPMLPGDPNALADALAARVASVALDVLGTLEGAEADFDDPRWRHARDPSWQRERLESLAEALRARGVAIWSSELPPDCERLLVSEPTGSG